MQLQGKRIVVTGGASGIGEAVTKACAAEGARVAILDVQREAGIALACTLSERHPGAVGFEACDVSSAADVERAFAGAAAFLGGLDVLVHAAAVAPGGAAEAIAVEDWDALFGVNARGTFLANRAAFHLMKVQGGRILNFASAAGVIGYPGKAHYAATKGAVLAWTRSVAREWGAHGITVNAIAPAMATPMYAKTRSGMTATQLAAHDEHLRQQIPIGGRLGDPARDLAPVIVFLAGDGARFITGQTLPIDGGTLMLS